MIVHEIHLSCWNVNPKVIYCFKIDYFKILRDVNNMVIHIRHQILKTSHF